MNLFSNLSTKKNLNNPSSISAIKQQQKDNSNNLFTLSKTSNNKTRYSYQQQMPAPLKLQRNSSYHDINTNNSQNNNKFSTFSQIKYYCFNHKNTQATHCALQNTQDPLYCCKRCAILIASKGFDINPIYQSEKDKQNDINLRNKSASSKTNVFKHKRGITQNNLAKPKKISYNQKIKQQLQSTWNLTKQTRKQSLSKIEECINNLTQSIQFIQDFYYTIQSQIQKQKQSQILQMINQKQSIENIKKQTNNYYLIYLEQIRKIKQTLTQQGQYPYQQYETTIKKIHKGDLKLNLDEISFLKDIKSYKINNKKEIHFLCENILDTIKKSYQPQNIKNSSRASYPYLHVHNNIEQSKRINRTNSGTLSINSSVNHSNILCSIKQINSSIASSNLAPSRKSIGPIKFTKNQIKHNEQNQQSVRSLQLSFDQADNHSELFNTTKRQQSNNFTLNQYLYPNNNKSLESSYMSNLLLNSMDI